MDGSAAAHVKALIRRRYTHLAASAGTAAGGRPRALRAGYKPSSLARVPAPIVQHWSGCGALAEAIHLKGVRTIVDLGSGSGLDVWLMATRRGPPRQIIAVDLTPEMLVLLGEHLPPASTCQIRRVAGDMEQLPLVDAACDLVVANASINLALDKQAVFAEAARILRPGGRLHVCELMRDDELPAEVIADPMGHAASLGGVASEQELYAALVGAGFVEVQIGGHRPFRPVVAVTIEARKPDQSGMERPKEYRQKL